MQMGHARGFGLALKRNSPHLYKVSAAVEVHHKCAHCQEQGGLIFQLSLLFFTLEFVFIMTT